MCKRVLVLDGNQRSSLAVTRSLGRKGVPVIVGEQTRRSLAGASRYCAASVTYPAPGSSPDGFLEALRRTVGGQAIDVVLPMTDTTTGLLLRHPEACGSAVLPFPPRDSYTRLAQKAELLELARSLDIRVPSTLVITSPEDRFRVYEQVRFPVAVKPVYSKVDLGGRWISVQVEYARDRGELEQVVIGSPCLGKVPLLIQQQITGVGHGVFALFDRGHPVAVFAHRRLRERPPTGGVSVLCESVLPEPAAERAALALLSHVGWHGVAMVEFKLDHQGMPWLMEVNGRFWGSLQLAIDAGVDFPWLLYRLATGESVEPPTAFRLGVKSRWLLGDLDSLYWVLAKGDYSARRKWRAIREFLRLFGSARYEVNRLDDLRPFLHELGDYLRDNGLGNRHLAALKARVERHSPRRLHDYLP
jgi:predicted ATP-grasp superfamily ATP-dependent carboligase